MDNKTFQQEVNNRLANWFEKNKIWLIWIIASLIISHISLYFYYSIFVNTNKIKEFIFEHILELIFIEFFGLLLSYLYLSFYKIPSEIYRDQKKIIEEQVPGELPLEIKHGPTNKLTNINGDTIKSVFLLIKNTGNKKIVELRAILSFDHFYYWPEPNRVMHVGYELNSLLFWQDNTELKKEIHLRPDLTKILVLCELLPGKRVDGKDMQLALLSTDPVPSNSNFNKESIFSIYILFQGKFEDEYVFRSLYFSSAIYAKPEEDRILFLDNAVEAYEDISRDLVDKYKRYTKWQSNKK